MLPLAYLEIRSIVACYMCRVTLRENGDFLLNVLNLILCLFQVNNLDGYHILWVIVNPIKTTSDRVSREEGERGREREEKRKHQITANRWRNGRCYCQKGTDDVDICVDRHQQHQEWMDRWPTLYHKTILLSMLTQCVNTRADNQQVHSDFISECTARLLLAPLQVKIEDALFPIYLPCYSRKARREEGIDSHFHYVVVNISSCCPDSWATQHLNGHVITNQAKTRRHSTMIRQQWLLISVILTTEQTRRISIDEKQCSCILHFSPLTELLEGVCWKQYGIRKQSIPEHTTKCLLTSLPLTMPCYYHFNSP